MLANADLKFPGTTDDVKFSGYDSKAKMVEFTKMVLKSASFPDYVPDPSDPGLHRLPMAPNATIKSFAGDFPFETCPPVGCTPDLVMQSVLGHEGGIFWAHIHVNSADQIDSVIESDY